MKTKKYDVLKKLKGESSKEVIHVEDHNDDHQNLNGESSLYRPYVLIPKLELNVSFLNKILYL
jgi:hypothetical protein